MQTTRVVLMMLLFTFAAIGAYAQGCPVQETCPAAPTCPAQPECNTCTPAPPPCCPTPTCAPTCTPAPAPTCPTCQTVPAPVATPTCGNIPACPGTFIAPPSCAVGAGFGAGPLPILDTTCAGADFDRVYIQNMFTLHNQIIALANQGAQQATSGDLRNISVKIRNEQTDLNRKLAMWYGDMGLGQLSACNACAGNVCECLSGICAGPGFDAVYAQTLSEALMKTRDSAAVSVQKIASDDLRYQANLVQRVSQKEIDYLQRWIAGHSVAPAGAGPAPGGCPTCGGY